MAEDVAIDPKISLTPEALEMAVRLSQEEPAHRGLPLRVYIEGKGCDGFYYGVAFDERQERDLAVQQGEMTLIIDPESLSFMDGSVVTWVDDERGRGFLVQNPNHRRFRGKFYKLKSWRDRLARPGVTSSAQ